jgi:hypothetical protein
MQEKNCLVTEANIEKVVVELEQWRKNKKGGERIPESLWEAAVDLTRHYSIYHVSRRLRLSYADLKKRVHNSKEEEPGSCKFIELTPAQVVASGGECIIEMHRRDGAGMKITVRGAMDCDLIELGKAFWTERS